MDARSRYTNRVIREQLLLLIREKPLEKITVKELCERAEINRATFYKYYDNPYDLLEKMESERLDRLAAQITENVSATLSDVFEIILKELSSDFEFYHTLFFQSGDDNFRKRLLDLCYQSNIRTIRTLFPNLTPTEQDWLYFFAADGLVGVLDKWMEGNMKESVAEVLEFVNMIIYSIDRMARHFAGSRYRNRT